MFRVLMSAARAAIHHRRPLFCLAAIAVIAARLPKPHPSTARRDVDAAEFDRLLRWLSQGGGAAIHWPAKRLRQRLIEHMLRSGPEVRARIQSWIVAALHHPREPAFDQALALAGTLPTPHARPMLLAFLADDAVPPTGAGPPAHSAAHVARLTEAIDALALIADPRDCDVFRYLASRYGGPAGEGENDARLARRAALALAKADPAAAKQSLSARLQRDPAIVKALTGKNGR